MQVPLKYYIRALIWISLIYLASSKIASAPIWYMIPTALVFGLPLFFAIAYSISVYRSRNVLIFNRQGVLHWLHSGRTVRYLFWFFWCLAFSYLLVAYMATARLEEWIVIFLAIVLFPIFYWSLHRGYANEIKQFAANEYAMRGARWVSAVLLATFHLAILYHTDSSFDGGTLGDAIAQEKEKFGKGYGGSLIAYELTNLMAAWEGLKIFTFYELGAEGTYLYLIAIWIGSLSFFYYINLALSSFLITQIEYRRTLAPLNDADISPIVSTQKIALATGVAVVLGVFIFAPGVLYLNEYIKSYQQQREGSQTPSDRIVENLEMIGERFYKVGTIEEIRSIQVRTMADLNPSMDGFCTTLNSGFNSMESNVDGYLDWYYTLGGEYSRLVALGTGRIQEMMLDKMQTALVKNAPFSDFEIRIRGALESKDLALADYQAEITEIMASNEVIPDGLTVNVVNFWQPETVNQLSGNVALFDTGQRFLISGSVAVTAAISTKVVGKVAAKGVIKAGAKALTKMGVGKAAGAMGGAATGAATGAAIGSVVPIFGTAAGAVVGGIIGGVAIGLTVEKVLIELEELYSRDAHRESIVSTIREQHAELSKELGCLLAYEQ